MSDYVAHLAHANGFNTACGEPWQGWQEPFDMDLLDPRAYALPPFNEPRPHRDPIRQCQACQRVSLSVAA